MINKTPAVTIVAAWINADTGVGPSIASGSQICNPSWADLPITPISNNDKKVNISVEYSLFEKIKNISLISKDPEYSHMNSIPNKNPISPILFIIIALKADLLAWILVYQKLINK